MIIFAVGANKGKTTIRFAEAGHTVYAFEPVPVLVKYLRKLDIPNYIVIPKAVHVEDTTMPFHIQTSNTTYSPFGCSSLYEWEDSLDTTWADRTDLYYEETISVETVRMDTFINFMNIPRVDYLHCDAQGNDINVLKSFGSTLDILQAGVVEVAHKNPLYKADNSLKDAVEFLESNKFQIRSQDSNDKYNNEYNLHFSK